MEDAKLSARITHAKQTPLMDFMNNVNDTWYRVNHCPCSFSDFLGLYKKEMRLLKSHSMIMRIGLFCLYGSSI